MYYELFDKLTNIETIDNFYPRYVLSPKKAFKYNDTYFHSIDDEVPRYCDLNITYITTNYYLFQKLRTMYDTRFLPYMTVWHIPYTSDLNVLKNKAIRLVHFDSWRTYNFDTANLVSLQPITNKTQIRMYNEIHFNLLNNSIYIPDILYCIGLSKHIYIDTKIFLETVDKDTLYELCDWLDCDIEDDNHIITTNLNIPNFNKLLTINTTYVNDYILDKTHSIPMDMSYIDFLNSNLW